MPCTAVFGQAHPELLTPKAPSVAQIHGPKIYGAKPGHPFLYRIPCTGVRPIHFSVKGLPPSLKLDAEKGIISGSAPQQKGDYPLIIEASNSQGKATRPFKIVVGDTIGLTPQMGWNGWYTFYERISESDIRQAASAMISSGMADFGYQYVDIDGCWQRKPGSDDPVLKAPVRDALDNILPNARFNDMSALTAYIHSLGLKAGIYTSPGPVDCAGYEGSYQHENADARQFAAWGFDLLKYDWCSYGNIAKDKSLEEFQKPYVKMGGIVRDLDRDVVLNMCQYGMGDVWKWGREVGGNSWRTTGDLGLAPNGVLPAFYSIAFANMPLDSYAGPGGWNDPDYILIGTIGDDTGVHATTLTPDEQYSYMSMWSLMAAPLLFSGDMTKLDPFTLNVLCNSEVIDIDQDSLGKQAHIIRKTDRELVLAKPLEDGSLAIGLFNLTQTPASIAIDWKDLARSGRQTVRDVWRQKDIGTFADGHSFTIAPHGVGLMRVVEAHR